MLLCDLHLAQRLELAHNQGMIEQVETQSRLFPETGAAGMPLGGGSSVTRARRGMWPSLVDILNQRHYRVGMFTNVYVRTLEEFVPAPSPEVLVTVAAPLQAVLWEETCRLGFHNDRPVDERDWFTVAVFHRPAAICYIAWVNGDAAGGGLLELRDGIGVLSSTATRPPFRGCGVQTALLQRRLADATAAGCLLATIQTMPGTASQRNVQRAGFSVAYTKLNMVQL